MKDDVRFLKLLDLYLPLLTATQQEIADLYFNYDLSLGEIAEQKGVSRQSVSDCLQKCRKQLETYEEKLGFSKETDRLSAEFAAYRTHVETYVKAAKEKSPESKAELEALEKSLSLLSGAKRE